MNLYRTMHHRYQRAERGWSDRDTWDTGGYLLEVTSGMLKELAGEKSYLKWDDYFSTNFKSKVYGDFDEVIKDIDDYIAFDELAWADSLGFKMVHGIKEREDGHGQLISLNTPEEELLIRKAIKDSHAEWKRRYAKMRQAMIFVADNIPGLWD